MKLERAAMRYVAERQAERRFRGRTPLNVTGVLFNLAKSVPEVEGLTRRRVEKWLRSQEVAPSTARAYLSIVRAFSAWLVDNRFLRRDPCAGIPNPRQPRVLPRSLQSERVERLFSTLPDSRAELVCSLMVQEGLRCCEVVNLEVGDIDFSQRSMLVRGKGGHERVLPISDETWGYLLRYSSAVAGPLIRSAKDPHKGLTPHYLSTLVSGWMREAGIKSKAYDGVAAHSLRHTMATDVLKGGATIREVQVALGHASLSTTQRYLGWSVGELRTALAGRTYRPV